MEIHSAHSVQAPEPALRRLTERRSRGADGSIPYADEIDVALLGLEPNEAVRRSFRIAQIQEELTAGTYDSIERLAATVYRLVDELGL